MKGAPEKIWSYSDKILIDGDEEIITEEIVNEYNTVNRKFAKNSERVLGLARYHLPKEQFPLGFQFELKKHDTYNFKLEQMMTFIGLYSMTDPPRESVPEAVMKCITAGIKVIMVTGDQPITATAIARQVNIIRDPTVTDIMEEEHISYEEAFKKAKAITVTGAQLMEAMKLDEGLPESEKGSSCSCG